MAKAQGPQGYKGPCHNPQCRTYSTPQWRTGFSPPGTFLCNACWCLAKKGVQRVPPEQVPTRTAQFLANLANPASAAGAAAPAGTSAQHAQRKAAYPRQVVRPGAERPREPGRKAAASTPEDHNYDVCTVCGVGGDIICCEVCPFVFHPACHGYLSADEARLDSEEDWECFYCHGWRLQLPSPSGSSLRVGRLMLPSKLKPLPVQMNDVVRVACKSGLGGLQKNIPQGTMHSLWYRTGHVVGGVGPASPSITVEYEDGSSETIARNDPRLWRGTNQKHHWQYSRTPGAVGLCQPKAIVYVSNEESAHKNVKPPLAANTRRVLETEEDGRNSLTDRVRLKRPAAAGGSAMASKRQTLQVQPGNIAGMHGANPAIVNHLLKGFERPTVQQTAASERLLFGDHKQAQAAPAAAPREPPAVRHVSDDPKWPGRRLPQPPDKAQVDPSNRIYLWKYLCEELAGPRGCLVSPPHRKWGEREKVRFNFAFNELSVVDPERLGQGLVQLLESMQLTVEMYSGTESVFDVVGRIAELVDAGLDVLRRRLCVPDVPRPDAHDAPAAQDASGAPVPAAAPASDPAAAAAAPSPAPPA